MTNEPRDDRPLAEFVPLHPAAPYAVLAVPADTSYEIELDDRPAPGPAVYADITSPAGEMLPIVPPHLRSLKGIRKAACP